MTEEPLMKIIFDGTLTGDFDEIDAKKRFQKTFKLKDSQMSRIFDGNSHTIKNNLSESKAMEMAFKIADIGYECSMEPMPDANDLSLQPGFVERRRKGNQRLKFRRGPRPGAIVPDRRSNNGRRKTDPDPSADIYSLD